MKDCKFCDKDGLLILPLRYAAVTGTDIDDPKLGLLPTLPATLGENVSDITLNEAKYAPRILREGYLYVLIKRAGILFWEGYLVLTNGYLYKFPLDLPPPSSVPFTCDPGSCGIDASMISIPKVESVEKIYLLFTPSPMTPAKLKEYKADPDGNGPGRYKMQTFDPKQWAGGGTSQKHSMKPEQLSSHVPEFMLFKQCADPSTSELGKLMIAQHFRMTAAAFDGVRAPGLHSPPPARLGALEFKMSRKKAAVFVLFDHIGVTQELNHFRNDAFAPVDQFMRKTERNVSNTYRFDIHNAIDPLRIAMENGIVADAKKSVEHADFWRRAMPDGEPIYPTDDERTRRAKMASNNNNRRYSSHEEWKGKNPVRAMELDNAKYEDEERLIGEAPARAARMWSEQFAPLIDVEEMKRFNETFNRLGHTTRLRADARAPQHMRWLQSRRVLTAFDLYDRDFKPSGEAMRLHVVDCIFGMEGSPMAESVLTEWATATNISQENLLLRAFTRNQNAVTEAANDAFEKITALVVGAGSLSAVPATSWQKATKGFVSAVKSTDSALDEWMRNQGQSANYLNPRKVANVEARFFYLVSTLTRSVARKGLGGKIELSVMARFNTLMHSCLGDLAVEIEHTALCLKIKPDDLSNLQRQHADADEVEKASAQRRNLKERLAHAEAKRIKVRLQGAAVDLIKDAQTKAKIELARGTGRLGWTELQTQLQASAEQHTNFLTISKRIQANSPNSARIPAESSPTNNYHQVRLGAVLAGIEAIAMVEKWHSLKSAGFNLATMEVTASLFSILSTTMDMMYSFTKSMRELPKYAAVTGIKDGADIVRGAFKLSAGFLSVAAGIIAVFVDMNARSKERDPIQKAILTVRVGTNAASAGGGALAAYSYASPLLYHIAEKHTNSKIGVRTVTWLARGAKFFSNRVLLLRAIAWVGWAGVAVTVADLSYAGYRCYIDSTALERWLSRCVFRKNKSIYPYKDETEELTELAKAQNSGQEYDAPTATAGEMQSKEKKNAETK